jgi:adenosylcobinamide-GDP ribazoletransferase
MIGRQARLFLCALQMLTRLPIPRLSGFEGDWIARSAPYYPVVGWIVGGLCAVVLLLTNWVWPEPIAAILAVAAGLLATGGLHEDGLADTVDGLCGGHTPQHRLEIMKDSCNGSYAALVLWVILILKAAVLATLSPTKAALALVLVHGAARALPVMVMASLRYAGDPETAKFKSAPLRVHPVKAMVALVLGLVPLLLLLPLDSAALSVGLAALSAAGMALVARRLVGGFTGDVLGAVEQVAEVALLLGISARIAAL